MDLLPYMIIGILVCVMAGAALISICCLFFLIGKVILEDKDRGVKNAMLNQNLQNKMITFCMYSDEGKWKGTGKGKVMGVDRGDRLFVSIRKHPFYQEGDLVQIYPWEREGRQQPDVIFKVEEA